MKNARARNAGQGSEHPKNTALELYARGYTVIPVGDDKKPLNPWKDHARVRPDLETTKAMPWDRAAQIAVLTGPTSGDLFALDWDVKNGEPGLEARAQFKLEHPGEWPEQTTRSGGVHTLARGVGRNSDLYLDGERCGDTRGAGGYVVAWEPEKFPHIDELPALPTLEGRVRLERKAERATPTPRPAHAPQTSSTGDSGKYVQRALENEIQAVQTAPEGTRNDTLNRAAFALGQFVGAGALEENQAYQALKNAAITAGMDSSEIDATITSGLKAGKLEPRDMTQVNTKPKTGKGAKPPQSQGKKKSTSSRTDSSKHPYSDANGVLALKKPKEDGDGWHASPLCNFTARIASETVRDDGAERTNLFTITGKLASGAPLPTIDVISSSFASLSWVTAQWGARAIIRPGQSIAGHVRAAIQELSNDDGLSSRTVYAHTGWRKLENGQNVFLHAGGGIGEHGPVNDLEVSLKGSLERYALPDPPKGGDLIQAVLSSFASLEVAPDRVSLPLWLSVIRAALGPARFTLFLDGRTGSRKSGLAALALQHYGPTFDRHTLPGNWTSTENALERLCFEGKDVPVVIDDFNPTGGAQEVKRWHSKAERVLRAQGNGTGRGRMVSRPGGILEQRPDTPPRGLVVVTGEDVPTGHSLRARLFIIEVQPGDVNLEKLIAASSVARSGEYARALAGFVQWLAPKLEEVQARHATRAAELTARFPAAHGRTTDTAADLMATLEVFAKFALETGAITTDQAQALETRAFQALGHVTGAQAQIQQGSDPVRRFLELLEAVLSGGHAHIADSSTGKEPANRERYGWREKTIGAGENERTEWQPQGKLIGWRAKDGALYLEPEGAFGAVQRLSGEQGEGVPLQGRTLWKRMGERNLIARDGDQSTVKRRFLGAQKRVVHLFAHALALQEEAEKELRGGGVVFCRDIRDTRESPVWHDVQPVPENGVSLQLETGTGLEDEAGQILEGGVPANSFRDGQVAGTGRTPSGTANNAPSLKSLQKTHPHPLALSGDVSMVEGEL